MSWPFRLLSASRAANASAMPWSISALSWASVTGVVMVVVVAGVDLVVSADSVALPSESAVSSVELVPLALTSERIVSLAYVDYTQASRESLASLSISLAVRA
ncbi:hypothetical protein Tco_1315392 [Tanacetum coccineum]